MGPVATLALHQCRVLRDDWSLAAQVSRNIQSSQNLANQVSAGGVSDFLQRNAGGGRILPALHCQSHRRSQSLHGRERPYVRAKPVIEELACSIAHFTLHARNADTTQRERSDSGQIGEVRCRSDDGSARCCATGLSRLRSSVKRRPAASPSRRVSETYSWAPSPWTIARLVPLHAARIGPVDNAAVAAAEARDISHVLFA